MKKSTKVPQIIELINQGLTVKEIVEEVGCTRANVHSVAKRYDIKLNATRQSPTEFSREELRRIRSLKINGASNPEIAKELNCSVWAIKRLNKGLGENYRNQYTSQSFDDREKHAKIMINNYLRNRDIEYDSGYTGCDNEVNLRCKKCGAILVRSMKTIRGNKVQCQSCEESKKENKRIRLEEAKKKKEERKEEIRQARLARKEKEKLEEQKKKEHPCVVCGRITTNPKYCSKKCANKINFKNKELRRERRKKDAIIDKDISLEKLFKRDKGICYICGLACNYDDYEVRNNYFIAGEYYPSIEHVKPLSKGGLHSWDNVKLAHRRCNTCKGAREVM